jgi:hypothetical protein
VYPGHRFWNRRIVFQTNAWRVDGQPVRKQFVLVDFETPLGTVARWQPRIAPGEVISFESTGIWKMPRGGAFLRLSRFLGPAIDPELQEIAAAARKPDVRSTEFGELVAKPGEDYSCTCVWHGTPVTLDLSPDEEDVEATLAAARRLHAEWGRWEGQLRALVTGELLPLWKDWHADEDPIDGDTLYGRLTLERIRVMDDGQVQLMMDAGGQFTDHEIVVDGTVEGGPEDIYPEG